MQSLPLLRQHAKSNAKPSIMKLVTLWAFRIRTRRNLATLPDYILKDIGLTAEDAQQEAQRPFWH
ncbi:DUF1127 domain-containing protein [Thioclava kandeliae]